MAHDGRQGQVGPTAISPRGVLSAGETVQTDLVIRASRGDEDAFAELAGAAIDRLYAVAQRILRDTGAAEDAVQHALVAAWRELPRLRDPERFDAWTYRLLVNACHRELRDRRTNRANVLTLDPRAGGAGQQRPALRSRRARAGVPPPDARPADDPRPPPLPWLRADRDRRHARHPRRHGAISTPLRPEEPACSARSGRSHCRVGRTDRMSGQLDLERRIDAYFAEGPGRAPDHLLGQSLRAATAERQVRRSWLPGGFGRSARRDVGLVLAGAAAALVLGGVVLWRGGFIPVPGPTDSSRAAAHRARQRDATSQRPRRPRRQVPGRTGFDAGVTDPPSRSTSPSCLNGCGDRSCRPRTSDSD